MIQKPIALFMQYLLTILAVPLTGCHATIGIRYMSLSIVPRIFPHAQTESANFLYSVYLGEAIASSYDWYKNSKARLCLMFVSSLRGGVLSARYCIVTRTALRCNRYVSSLMKAWFASHDTGEISISPVLVESGSDIIPMTDISSPCMLVKNLIYKNNLQIAR